MLEKMNYIPPNINNFSQNPLTTNSSIPQELIYQNNQFLLQNQQNNISLPPYNYQYNSQYQYPLNKNIPNSQNMNSKYKPRSKSKSNSISSRINK